MKSLKSRLRQSGLDSAETTPRRSRAMRVPLDSTPDTFMGASVNAMSDPSASIQESPSNGAAEAGDASAPSEATEAPKRRVRRERRALPTTNAVDPSLFEKFAASMGAPATAPLPPTPAEQPATSPKTPSTLSTMSMPSPKEPTPPHEETALPPKSQSGFFQGPTVPSPGSVSKEASPVSAKVASPPKEEASSLPQVPSPISPAQVPDLPKVTSPKHPSPSPVALKGMMAPSPISKEPTPMARGSILPLGSLGGESSPLATASSPRAQQSPDLRGQMELERVKRELEELKLERTQEREDLEDFKLICAQLLPQGQTGARPLAKYISELQDNEYDLDNLKKAFKARDDELRKAQRELAEQKEAYLSLLASSSSGQTAEAREGDNAADRARIAQLEEELKRVNEELNAIRNPSNLPEAIKKMQEEEEEAIKEAEKEFNEMKRIIEEQNEFIENIAKTLADEEKEIIKMLLGSGVTLEEIEAAASEMETSEGKTEEAKIHVPSEQGAVSPNLRDDKEHSQ